MHRISVVLTLCFFVLFTSIGQSQTKTSKGKTKSKSKAAAKKKTGDAKLSPLGRPVQDKVKVSSMRYFVWYDSSGWHLRTASKQSRRFVGSIKLTEGTFGKLRPVGIESKKGKDKWQVNKERNEIKFDINTGGSFDGFDFSAKAQSSAKVEFDLKFTERVSGKEVSFPKRIFIGRSEKHPKAKKFSFAVKPR